MYFEHSIVLVNPNEGVKPLISLFQVRLYFNSTAIGQLQE